jgi:hypothetical protein
MIIGSWLLPQYWPCHAFGQFFQRQCMQSTLPRIPGQPLAAFSPNNLDISCSFGARRYVGQSSPCRTYAPSPWLYLHRCEGIHWHSPPEFHKLVLSLPRIFLVATKIKQTRGIPPTFEIPSFCNASFYNLHKQRTSHLISMTKEVGRIGWYLREVVLHEYSMPEHAIPRDA